MVEEVLNIVNEFYFGVVVDCFICCIVFMVLIEGGVEIEKVVEEILELIYKVVIDLLVGL